MAVSIASPAGASRCQGGECLLQCGLRAALLEEAHHRGINTAIETAGNYPWSFMEKVLPHVDTVLHDHKLTDPVRHKKWCGADNSRILANFKRAYETFPDKTFIARTPVIPGVNDDEEHIRAVLAFIRPYPNVIKYELLPYHRYGETQVRIPRPRLRTRRFQQPRLRNPAATAGHHRRGIRSHQGIGRPSRHRRA